MNLNSLARLTVTNEVAEALGRAIIGGEFNPGETLDVEAIRAALGISKSAFREGRQRLEGKGLVRTRSGSKTWVCPIEGWNLFDADVQRWIQTTGDPHGLAQEAKAFAAMLAEHTELAENRFFVHALAAVNGGLR